MTSLSESLHVGMGAVAGFNAESIVMDRRHSGFPCRADRSCQVITRTSALRAAHELATHDVVLPTSPPASAGTAPWHSQALPRRGPQPVPKGATA